MWLELNVGKHRQADEDKFIYVHIGRLQAVEKTYINPNTRQRDYDDDDGDASDFICVPRVHIEGVGEYYVHNKTYEELKVYINANPAIFRTGGTL